MAPEDYEALYEQSRFFERLLNNAPARLANLERELATQKRGTANAEAMLCNALGVESGADVLDAIERLKGRIAELEKALEPFAALLHDHHERLKDSQPVYAINSAVITVGDIRKAKKETKP
jgi:uncharacterized coiled-coil protein SlyX